jgi:hypothetical protein
MIFSNAATLQRESLLHLALLYLPDNSPDLEELSRHCKAKLVKQAIP